MSANSPDITERAYTVTLELLQRTSSVPTTAEIAKLLERFAIDFGYSVGAKLLEQRLNTEETAIAVRNAVERCARGEP